MSRIRNQVEDPWAAITCHGECMGLLEQSLISLTTHAQQFQRIGPRNVEMLATLMYFNLVDALGKMM